MKVLGYNYLTSFKEVNEAKRTYHTQRSCSKISLFENAYYSCLCADMPGFCRPRHKHLIIYAMSNMCTVLES